MSSRLISCNGLGHVRGMESYLSKKKSIFKLRFNKRCSRNARVSTRNQVNMCSINGQKEISVEGKITGKQMEVSDNGLGIVQFMRGKVFLITGATGFLAKGLIEKIIRTVPDVRKIYLLIKASDKEVAMDRLKNQLKNKELFRDLQQSHGKSYYDFMLSKLIPVAGDLCEPNLGMEVDLGDHIANEVDIIINSAANTTFDERFDVSLDINTLGPCRIMSFAKTCKKLQLFLHVSTAYVNRNKRGIVMEKPFHIGDSRTKESDSSENPNMSFPLLDVDVEVNKAFSARDDFDYSLLSRKMKDMGLERALTYGWHNVYEFTKAMGEMLIVRDREKVPVVIIRPSIIESTFREPTPGWIDGIRMLDPMFLLYGKGVLTGFPGNERGIVDVVPVDMVVNAILAAIVKHSTVRKPELRVYHIASSVANPLVIEDMLAHLQEYYKSSPCMDFNREPINVKRMELLASVDHFHTHIQTEVVQRSAYFSQGKNLTKRLPKSLQMAKHLANIYEPYAFYEARFDNSNIETLWKEMNQEEKNSFGYDVRDIDWGDYLCNIYLPGLMRHAQNRGIQIGRACP